MKLALSGTHSSGKTSLIHALSGLNLFKHYEKFTENTRKIKNEYKVKINDDSELISQFIFLGERCKELMHGNILCDRSIYDVCSYTLSSNSISWYDKRKFVENCIPILKEYDLIIYVSPEGVEIEDNGLRSIDNKYRDKIDYTIKEMLEEYPPKNLLKISGSTEQRISQINEYLSSHNLINE